MVDVLARIVARKSGGFTQIACPPSSHQQRASVERNDVILGASSAATEDRLQPRGIFVRSLDG